MYLLPLVTDLPDVQVGSCSGVRHLEEIKEAGLELPAVNQIEVRSISGSLRSGGDLCLARSQIHPYCQQKEIVEYCRTHGIAVEAYSPLVRGKWEDTVVNVGKKVRPTPIPALTRLFALAHSVAQYNKGPAQTLIRWSLQHEWVSLSSLDH